MLKEADLSRRFETLAAAFLKPGSYIKNWSPPPPAPTARASAGWGARSGLRQACRPRPPSKRGSSLCGNEA
jgi:hypothetical protein